MYVFPGSVVKFRLLILVFSVNAMRFLFQ